MTQTDITGVFPNATAEQIEALLNINGADIENTKKDYTELSTKLKDAEEEIKRLQEENPTVDDLKREKERADNLQLQIDTYAKNENIRTLREKISKEKGIPVNLLTAETEDGCSQQADEILSFVNSVGYPTVRDAGEPEKTQETSTSKEFADWFNKSL